MKSAVYVANQFLKNCPGYSVSLLELDPPDGAVGAYMFKVSLDGEFIAARQFVEFYDDGAEFVDLATDFLYSAAGKC